MKGALGRSASGSLAVSVLYFVEYTIDNEYCTEKPHHSGNIEGN